MRRESERAFQSSVKPSKSQRAALIGLASGDRDSTESSLEELARLAQTAGAIPVFRTLQERRRPHPGTFLFGGPLC